MDTPADQQPHPVAQAENLHITLDSPLFLYHKLVPLASLPGTLIISTPRRTLSPAIHPLSILPASLY